MDYVVVSVAALLVAALVLYSGFGLGTLLMPVFALFFPVPVAIASTAAVHLANNLFRLGFVGRQADLRVALTFGLPAIPAAILGALLLTRISGSPLLGYEIGGRTHEVTALKLTIAALILVFAIVELSPKLSAWKMDRRYLPAGGVLSGFFGGLSGHQGALRSAALLGAGLSPNAFVGTGSVVAFMVDVTRLVVYGAGPLRDAFSGDAAQGSAGVVATAIAAAFVGTYLGSRFLQKVTIGAIRRLVGVLLVLLASVMAAGLV
jgi:uncharacterized protein